MARHFQGKVSVLEFGAGIGTLAIEWQKQTNVRPECVEVDAELQQAIVERGFPCYPSIGAVEKKFDGIYSSNVLEHIEDDLNVLKQLRSIVTDGGVLAVYVPALMQLYSATDRSFGHWRRYRRAELIDKAKAAGFEVIDCYYVDSLGLLAWFTAMWSEKSLRFYDTWIYPVSGALDDLFMRHIAGKNLLLIAKAP
jgi:SAM-dependent methyltransferase